MADNNPTQQESFESQKELLESTLKSYLECPQDFPSYFETMDSIDVWFKKEAQQ